MSHDKDVVLQPFGTLFYLNFRSSTIQRWAARLVKNEHYYALTPFLWRRLGLGDLPVGIAGKISASATLYFKDAASAESARSTVIDGLLKAGVLR